MSGYALPAVIALFIKLGVLVAARKAARLEKPFETSEKRYSLAIFTTVVSLMAGHNLAELLAFFEYVNGHQQELILRWYYVMTACSLAAIVIYAVTISRCHQPGGSTHKVIMGLVIVSALMVSGLALFSNAIVEGVASMKYIMTARQGGYYWLFQVFSGLGYVIILSYLIWGYRHAKTHATEIQCGFTLFALAPVMLVGITLLLLMNTGAKANKVKPHWISVA